MYFPQFFDAREYNTDFEGSDETSEEEGEMEDAERGSIDSSDDEENDEVTYLLLQLTKFKLNIMYCNYNSKI